MIKFQTNKSRRDFLKNSSAIAALLLTPPLLVRAVSVEKLIPQALAKEKLQLEINGKMYDLQVDVRTSLLDLLREQIGLTGTKKGCDMGQCGACIVHVNGKRLNSCMSLAIDHQSAKVVTIEGLAKGDQLHPMQAAFVKHDAMQCGYCTPGQIMSAIACVREGHANNREQIKDYMQGNICRCGSYQNIVDAIIEVKKSGQPV
jgi:xanthine dehydrogenase YagT iron-sulfur-binding subunit